MVYDYDIQPPPVPPEPHRPGAHPKLRGNMAEKIVHITDDTFETEVLQSETPVLVDFWAEWCGPCLRVAPVLEELASELGDKVKVVKVDIDANPNTARDYAVLSVPTLTVFKGGQPVQSVAGARPKGDLLRLIESAL